VGFFRLPTMWESDTVRGRLARRGGRAFRTLKHWRRDLHFARRHGKGSARR